MNHRLSKTRVQTDPLDVARAFLVIHSCYQHNPEFGQDTTTSTTVTDSFFGATTVGSNAIWSRLLFQLFRLIVLILDKNSITNKLQLKT